MKTILKAVSMLGLCAMLTMASCGKDTSNENNTTGEMQGDTMTTNGNGTMNSDTTGTDSTGMQQ
ncbi:hypothetical protein [Dyadobacter sediminis]|uniref:Uncharacterized protein n=1 Tax=Dyadobacter sediminis TaxID=1493691 RepID=A0A5R9KC51_9BACT|nr:hypothetical protein [Dyadobacter sediminis]TLU92338.1 hypothetical protein FEM55_16565 [Dyadobacter sediminis]GGB95289.1 hypothetical protein GCM10011325_23330 [Dyadobacter sediminis]